MIGDLFSNDAFVSLNKGMDATALRQQVIANNVANINTPGYKKQDVSFEDEFTAALEGRQSSQAGRLSNSKPLTDVGIRVTTVSGTSMRNDGNNVDIDEEMEKLAENNIRFQAMSKLMSDRFGALKIVINGGR